MLGMRISSRRGSRTARHGERAKGARDRRPASRRGVPALPEREDKRDSGGWRRAEDLNAAVSWRAERPIYITNLQQPHTSRPAKIGPSACGACLSSAAFELLRDESTIVAQQLEDVPQFLNGVGRDRLGVEVCDVVADDAEFVEPLDESPAVQRPTELVP